MSDYDFTPGREAELLKIQEATMSDSNPNSGTVCRHCGREIVFDNPFGWMASGDIEDFDDVEHPANKWWQKHGQFMMSGGGRRQFIWACRGWIAHEQYAAGVEVTGESLHESDATTSASESAAPPLPEAIATNLDYQFRMAIKEGRGEEFTLQLIKNALGDYRGIDGKGSLWPTCDWCNTQLEKFAKEAGECLKCGAMKFEGGAARKIAELRVKLEQWTKWGVVEVAVRNPQVADYCKHWEGRAETAEAQLGLRNMILDLVATDELFVHPAEGGGWVFWVKVNVNDMFYPASDGEGIDMSEIPAVWQAWKDKDWPGVVRWVQEKRGGLKLRKSREEKILTIESLQAQLKTAHGAIKLILARIRNKIPWQQIPDSDVDGYIAEFERVSSTDTQSSGAGEEPTTK